MAVTLHDPRLPKHPKMLRLDGESLRKKLAVGRRVERTFEILGITKQEAAHDMGYTDPSTVSRWCSGTETPKFDRLETIVGFEGAYTLALAEKNPDMEVEHVIRLRRRA